MFEVYILECIDGSLYTGYARDVDKRFQLHVVGKGAKYTASHPPKEILYRKKFETKSEAMKEEWRIKGLTKKEKMSLITISN